jgi:hypothetical protein
MNSTWVDCCNLAVRQLNPEGINTAADGRTIQTYYCEFCKQENFQHPTNPTVPYGKQQEPQFFQHFPEAKNQTWILPTIIAHLTTEFCLGPCYLQTASRVCQTGRI